LQHKALMFLWTDGYTRSRTATGQLLLHGVMAGLRRHGISLIVDQLDEEGYLPAAITGDAVDGLFLHGAEPDPETAEVLRKLPTVWIFQQGGRSWGDRVQPDHRALGALALDHLVARGASDLCCMTFRPVLPIPFYTSRADAFAERADLTAGIRCRMIETGTVGNMDIDASRRAAADLARRFLKLRPQPDGLFVAHHLGNLVCDRIARAGIWLGENLHVVAGDSEQLDPALPLPVAMADVLPEEIGAVAADMLLWRLKNPRRPRTTHTVTPVLAGPTPSGQ
jgi:DNA-binding LacI/PurR family transcriptional regulator